MNQQSPGRPGQMVCSCSVKRRAQASNGIPPSPKPNCKQGHFDNHHGLNRGLGATGDKVSYNSLTVDRRAKRSKNLGGGDLGEGGGKLNLLIAMHVNFRRTRTRGRGVIAYCRLHSICQTSKSHISGTVYRRTKRFEPWVG
jgi:hypothetical protein